MRTILVLALIGLVFCSQPQGIFSPPVEKQLKDTHLGRVFLKLITLKSKAQQFDFSQLFTALDDLEAQIKQRIVDEGKQFQTDEVQYLTDVAFYQSQIAQYENEIATHEIDLQDSTEFRQELQKLLVTKSEELDQVKKSQSELVKSIANNQKTFEGQQSQYNNAIQAVDQAIELVGALRDGSFVSKKTNTVELLENSMKELTHRRVMYGPLIKGLAQILEPSFNDASAVSKVLKLLQTLRDNLSKSRQELESSYQAERAIDDHNLADYNQRVSNLSDIIIPTIQAEIQTKDVDIQTKSNLLKDANSNESAAKTNLETTNTRWVSRQNESTKLQEEYANQLALFPKISKELEQAGIRRK
ncbi:hypothetical protein pb186bvf_005593 [Paramecium bursaria]